jgi:hypothetical protein
MASAKQEQRAGVLFEEVRPANVAAPGQGVLGSPRGLGVDLAPESLMSRSELMHSSW